MSRDAALGLARASRQPRFRRVMLANKRRMQDLQQQLADLRARVARIDRKYARKTPRDFETPGESRPEKTYDAPAPPQRFTAERRYIEEWLCGEEIETPLGRHFETEKLYEAHRRHGSADIGGLRELPHDLLHTLSGGAIPAAAPADWAFLDTE